MTEREIGGPDRRPRARKEPPKDRSRTWESRVHDHALFWYHEEDQRKDSARGLTLHWCCPICRRTQSPAVNCGMEPVMSYWEPAKFVKRQLVKPADAYLSSFVCRYCNRKWDVKLEERPHE